MSSYYIKALDVTLLILYCALIYWLSDQSSLPVDISFFVHQDKLIHAGAYFIMTFFTLRAFRHFISPDSLLTLVSLGFVSVYGFSDEWHQYYVPGRMSDIMDWLADTAGSILFIYLYNKYQAKCTEKKQR